MLESGGNILKLWVLIDSVVVVDQNDLLMMLFLFVLHTLTPRVLLIRGSNFDISTSSLVGQTKR